MAYATDGTIGTQFSGSDGTTQRFALGTRIQASDGQVLIYVQASATVAISQYDFVTIDQSFVATPLMKSNADLGHKIGVSQFAMAVSEYGFVAVDGVQLLGNVTASATTGAFVATSATTGRITTSGTSQTEIQGVALHSAAGASATAVYVRLNNPHVDL